MPPLLMPQAPAIPIFLLLSGEAAQLVIVMRLERLGAEFGHSLCCHRHQLQQAQLSHLHLFFMSLQWEKLSPPGKQQTENVQRRLMSRFSLPGPEPSARSLPLWEHRQQITFKRQI